MMRLMRTLSQILRRLLTNTALFPKLLGVPCPSEVFYNTNKLSFTKVDFMSRSSLDFPELFV